MSTTLIISYVLIIILLLIISSFFSGSETALTAVSKARMHHSARQGNKAANRVLAILEQKEKLLGTILLGNNLVNILASALATSVLVVIFGEAGVIYATLILTILVVIFAELLPKSYAINNPDKLALKGAIPLRILIILLRPVTLFINALVAIILKILGATPDSLELQSRQEEELRGAIDLHRGENPEIIHERNMLKSILELDELVVEDVMTHRRNVEMLNLDEPVPKLMNQILSSRFTRIPVYKGDQDNIKGVLHVKSLLKSFKPLLQMGLNGHHEDENDDDAKSERDKPHIQLEKLASEPWFIPDSTSLMDQLLAFRERREHFAIVVDEYGDFMGIVTLEDILEEIVGDIDDETDIKLAGVKLLSDGRYEVEGTIPLRTLERELEWHWPDQDVATIAGLVLSEAKRIPHEGQVFEFYGYRFEVKKRLRNQIKTIIVTPPVQRALSQKD